MGVPANPAVATDAPDFEVRRILEERQPARIEPRGRGIEANRRPLAERFMRSLVVVVKPKGIEAALLGAERRLGRVALPGTTTFVPAAPDWTEYQLRRTSLRSQFKRSSVRRLIRAFRYNDFRTHGGGRIT